MWCLVNWITFFVVLNSLPFTVWSVCLLVLLNVLTPERVERVDLYVFVSSCGEPLQWDSEGCFSHRRALKWKSTYTPYPAAPPNCAGASSEHANCSECKDPCSSFFRTHIPQFLSHVSQKQSVSWQKLIMLRLLWLRATSMNELGTSAIIGFQDAFVSSLRRFVCLTWQWLLQSLFEQQGALQCKQIRARHSCFSLTVYTHRDLISDSNLDCHLSEFWIRTWDWERRWSVLEADDSGIACLWSWCVKDSLLGVETLSNTTATTFEVVRSIALSCSRFQFLKPKYIYIYIYIHIYK